MGFWEWIIGQDDVPSRDWVDTGHREWRTVKESGDLRKEQLFGLRHDLDTEDEEWVPARYDRCGGGYKWIYPIHRLIRVAKNGGEPEVLEEDPVEDNYLPGTE